MPDLADRIRDYVDAAQPSVTMDEVLEAEQTPTWGQARFDASPAPFDDPGGGSVGRSSRRPNLRDWQRAPKTAPKKAPRF